MRGNYYRLFLLSLLCGVMSLNICAQNFGISECDFTRYGVSTERVIAFDTLSWINTSNAASLGKYQLNSLGITQFGANITGGGYKLAAQSGDITSLGFQSDSYRALGKINLYGKFSFNQQWHSARMWSDNFDPYNGTPYIVGSNLAGTYTKQIFDFTVKAASNLLWNKILLGVGFDYKDGDFSRNRDPRSRSQLADYRITPSIIYQLSSHSSFGLNLSYRFYKEKMLKPVSKAESFEKYPYFLQKGMSEYSSTTILFFSRRYMNNIYAANLQYNYNKNSVGLLIDGGFSMRNELDIDESGQTPGEYKAYDFNLSADLSIKGDDVINSFKLRSLYSMGKAREYLQENVVTTDDKGRLDSYWRTIMKNLTYKNSTIDLTMSWRFYLLEDEGYKWFAGAFASFDSFGKKYIIPTSSASNNWASIDLEGGAVILKKQKSSLNIQGSFGFIKSLNSELVENTSLGKEKKLTINENVVVPDFAMLSSDSAKCGIELNYIIKNDSSPSLFVTLYGYSFIPTNIIPEKTLRYSLGASIGLLF